MSEKSRLMPISYYNPKQEIRLSAYADTIVLEPDGREQHLRAIRFGGYPEMVRAMSDAIYAGATLETEFAGEPAMLACEPKKYECHLSHDGIYAEATILSLDDADEARQSSEEEVDGQTNVELPPRKCVLFCPAGDRRALFEALDRKTAVPLIPEFQDYVLDELQRRRFLKPLRHLHSGTAGGVAAAVQEGRRQYRQGAGGWLENRRNSYSRNSSEPQRL